MKTITIAPRMEEINVSDSAISTRWNGGIFYKGNIARLRTRFSDEELKKYFQTAIGFSSKPWQLEDLLNGFFKIKAKVSGC